MTYLFEAFRDVLTAEEDASVEWRAITGLPRAHKRLFEIIGAWNAVPKVLPAGVPRGGWWCEVCGYASPPFHGNTVKERDPTWFVSTDDLAAVAGRSFFVLGQAPEFDLCVTRDRWKVMKEHMGATGCRSYAIGVLPEEESNRARPTRTWRAMKGLSGRPTP